LVQHKNKYDLNITNNFKYKTQYYATRQCVKAQSAALYLCPPVIMLHTGGLPLIITYSSKTAENNKIILDRKKRQNILNDVYNCTVTKLFIKLFF